MNQFQKYAADLVSAQGPEKALIIAESSLAVSKNVPNTYLYDEAAWYMDKDGSLQLARDQKKFVGVRERRLNKTLNFWTQVTSIIKKLNKGNENAK